MMGPKFKEGDKVRLKKYADYDETATQSLYGYTRQMVVLAESGKVFRVKEVSGSLVRIKGFNFRDVDVQLANLELENK